jgi:hypothetical protein
MRLQPGYRLIDLNRHRKGKGGASTFAASDEFAAGRAMNIRAQLITAV